MSKNDTRRDEVLFAFHEACEHPTAESITEWTRRYPPPPPAFPSAAPLVLIGQAQRTERN